MSEQAIPLPQDEAGTRRVLLKAGVGAMAACYTGALGYPVYRYLATPSNRAKSQGQISSVSIPQKDLPGAGSATMFLFGSRPSVLIHHADGHYVAFDAVCTHLGCTVRFEPQNNRIFCPCHGGTYDMNTGAVVAGPPPRPLKPYRVEVADGNVTVSRT
jgi:cytochrome b6-f complex iron-sulfur subunit